MTMDSLDLTAATSPERIAAAVAANAADGPPGPHAGHGPGGELESVRTAQHRGHEIVVRTRYTIEVDGRPFAPHVVVDNDGRVHYHGLPTRDFASVVALVEKAIDVFPDDFALPDPEDPPPDPHGHDHHHHEH